jgi:hypothetical protein
MSSGKGVSVGEISAGVELEFMALFSPHGRALGEIKLICSDTRTFTL